MKFPSWLSRLNPFAGAERRDVYIALALTLAALLLYVPGITWGLPAADLPGRTRAWGPDELAPIAPIYELRSAFGGDLGNPQYPLFHYLLIFVSYIPYFAWQLLIGGLANPQAGYPYGFTDAASSVKHLVLIARGVSLLMAAGCAIIAYAIGKRLWDRVTGALAAALLLSAYPMFYYAKISNVDVPAAFWMALVLLLFVPGLEDGFSTRRSVWMGIFAALAIATKDQNVANLLFLPVAVVAVQRAKWRDAGSANRRAHWMPLLIGGAVSVMVYAIASGLAVRPQKYLRHIKFVTGGSERGTYFRYSANWEGYSGLARETFMTLADCIGWLALFMAVAGILLCLRRQRSALWLLLPIVGFVLVVLLPIRHVALRFLIPGSFVLTLFAAHGMIQALRHRLLVARIAALAVLMVGAGWLVARGIDLNRAMILDSRHAGSAWLHQAVRPSQQVSFCSLMGSRGPALLRINILPLLPPGVTYKPVVYGSDPSGSDFNSEFVIAMGVEDFREHRLCPAVAMEGLKNGSLGYSQAAAFRTATRFEHPHLWWVNPQIAVYARRDIQAQLPPAEKHQ